jgi:hypothetical protein
MKRDTTGPWPLWKVLRGYCTGALFGLHPEITKNDDGWFLTYDYK